MASSQSYSVNLNINANAGAAKQQLKDLQSQLQQISNMKIDIGTGSLTADIEKASQAAMKLSAHLATATNPQTGNLDFTKFYTSIQKSGASLQEYGQALQNMGPAGQKAFVSLADSISKSEIPLRRTSKLVDGMWDNLKKTIGWQMSSSMIHGFIGSVQQAMGYAKDLNKSLTDIRIVTGQSSDQMATFAREANKAAKSLSTTTTDYTKASLIYYQQGLSDAEVKARTETTIKMANATGTSAQKVSDQMTAIWNNYDNGTKSLTHYADVMTALGAATASSTDEIAEGLQKFASISDTVGLSYEYAASALATITSTSRESADVVGNSLKTLFSRIQGLQLGETLDDGTTLNKYSTAMAKVGISIKDSSGELKSMDSILDEMGTTWKTLANDEKMALAQTVAGVRQYTQLMTLMENWDFFKQNLNIANTSAGTLDTQAAIYAESWEAASNRVRASWEGLWDNLISSDGFITMLDGLSGFINILDQMVTGLGGASGALLTFGGALTGIFNKQIASGISNVAYGIKMMMPGQRQNIINERNNFITEAKSIIGKDTEISLGHEAEYSARRLGLSKSLDQSLLYAQNQDKLSKEQQLIENIYARATETSYNEMLSASKNYDTAKEFRADFHGKFYDKNMTDNLLSHSLYDEMEGIRKQAAQYQKKAARITELGDNATSDEIALRNQWAGEARRLSSIYESRNELSNSIFNRGVSDKLNSSLGARHYFNQQKNIREKNAGKNFGAWSKEDQQAYTQANQQIQNIKQGTGFSLGQAQNFNEALIAQGQATAKFNKALLDTAQSGDVNTLISGLVEFQTTAANSMGSSKFIQDLIGLADQYKSGGDVEGFKSAFSQMQENIPTFMKQSMDTMTGAIYDAFQGNKDFIGKNMTREEFMKQAAQAYKDTPEADLKMRAAIESYSKQMEARQQNISKTEKIKSGAERAVAGSQGLMQAAAAGEALNNLVSTFQNGTATLSSTLTGLTSVFAQSAMGFQGLFTALNGLGGLSAGAAGGIALVATAILGLISTISSAIDRATVDSEEHLQNLINSNNTLQATADSTKENIATVQAQNESYLEGIKKIESANQNPETLAEDILASNKKALELINQYNLDAEAYKIGENGLIKIDENALTSNEQKAKDISNNADFANILGNALNQQAIEAEKREENIAASVADGYKHEINRFENGQGLFKGSQEQREFLEKYNLNNDGYFSTDEFAQMYLDGQLETYKNLFSQPSANYHNLEKVVQEYLNNENIEETANVGVENASRVIANKVLNDNGITSQTQEGYQAYMDFAADYIKDNYLNQEWISADNLKQAVNTEATRDEISRMLEDYGIAEGAVITGYKDGNIEYQAEGSTEKAYIQRETVNAWHAAEQVANNAQTIIDKSSKAWEDATGKYGKTAAEAGFNLEQFKTVVGASADSVQSLYQQSQMKTDRVAPEERNVISNSKRIWDEMTEEEQKSVEEIFSSNGIVNALGLTGNQEALQNIDIGSFEALMNSAKIAGDSDYSQIGNLFNTITEATGAESGEDLAKIVTALSSMDFTDNSYLNLMNLKSTLEAFGFSVNTGGLEALYAILVKLAGLGPGEDLADSAKDIADKRGALNKVTPGEAVDEATKNAAIEAGLAEEDFVKDENGNYVYNGTQKDIDNAKRINNQAYIDNQAKIDEQQAAYKKATEAGLDIAGDIKWGSELARAVGLDYNSEDETYEGEGNQNLALLETALRLAEGSIKDTLNNGSQEEIKSLIDQINQFMENGSMTEDQQNQTQEDQLAKITNASDMMEGINQARESGDKSAFLDEDGLISDEAMARLESMPDKSDRLTSALNDLEAAKQAVKAADDGNDETQTEEESRAQAIYEEAEAETALQAAIDDAAKSRGINNDLLANTVEMMRTSGLVTQQAGESLKDYNKRLLESAIDYEENSQGLAELQKAYRDYTKAVKDGDQNAEAEAFTKMQKAISKITKLPLNKVTKEFVNQAKAAGTLQKALNGDVEAIAELEAMGRELSLFDKSTNLGQAVDDVFDGVPEKIQGFADRLNKAMSTMNIGESFAAANAQTNAEIEQVFNSMVQKAIAGGADMNTAVAAATAELGEQGIDVIPKPVPVNAEKTTHHMEEQYLIFSGGWGRLVVPLDPYQKTSTVTDTGEMMGYEFRKKGAGGKGRSPGGGGGGGGGGKKEPKKVANKRKSQTVKRYKRNDFRRDNIQSMQKSEEQKKDYLYGESKIAQMEKINKLAEKEARITADRMSESRKYLEEDRQNLIRYMRKYNLEAEFDSDGFLASYEREWTKLHEEIAALYEDNLLTEEEEKLEEEYNVKLEELEGALEDYENSLKELREDIEKYEESLYKMYDTKLEQFEHRLEFRLELNEDDMNYVDFLLEALGDNASKAVDRISLITQKSTALFDNIVRVKENIQAIYDLSDDPFQMWATGGLDIDGLLTEAQVEQLREHRDQLMDYMKELLEMRETIQEEVLNVFDAWTEKIDHNISAIDHYTGVLEHFKNVIDITGKDVFGMSDSFMRSMESAAIDQSMDSIEVNKAYYESLVQANAEAEQALQEARARGDAESEEHWEEVVRSTSESMQSAQDTLLSALENTLTMISDQFTAAMEDAVEQFNKSIYASGGLEGLSDDYSLLREQADLMAEDYDKIYNLTKLTRNINKTLDDTNIIAGKQRLTKLLQEVNDLQKSGVELSKYDLEYLEAKYNLYLAQIELENAQSNKDTVQLSRDSEGNWSYVYTTNEEKVNEAQQKYEDALYEMQNMNHEYMEEMSSSMIETASKMSEEIANLQISDFANLEEYNNKVQEIREKYEKSLNLQNEELNKVIDNNESLYETDWQNYSKYTGYKISADKDWIDSFRETTLGHLMGSESVQSDFNQTIIGLTDTLAQGLSDAAVQYFTQMNTALQTYGSSIDGFSGHIVSMTKTVKEQSDEAAKATESMGERMETAFKDVVTAVKEWQEIEAPKIEEELEAIKTLIEQINESIRTSAELTTDKDTSIIGSSKAIELINDSGLFGSWKINKNGTIEISDGAETETTNFVDYNAKLLEELDDAIELYANGKISDDALAEMFKRYWAYKDIINRIYDTTDTDAEKKLEEKEEELRKKLGGSIKFDTGGYTGEWGHEGKIAMLHEKELVLNANDTSNFLEALNISRQLIEMIEMNARASSLGLGEMVASTIKDTSQTIEQQVSITAEFPNATDHSEIEEAFDNLINIASQYAYRNE